MKENYKIINCTPPWMTKNSKLWCNHTLDVNEKVAKKMKSFLKRVIDDRADNGKCFTPCSFTW